MSCGGRDYLLTRVQTEANTRAHGWMTRVRSLGDSVTNVADIPPTYLRYYQLSHNVAGVCVGEKVYLVGGQFRKVEGEQMPKHYQGIWISETDPRSIYGFAQMSTIDFFLPEGGVRPSFGGVVFPSETTLLPKKKGSLRNKKRPLSNGFFRNSDFTARIWRRTFMDEVATFQKIKENITEDVLDIC